MAFPAVPTGCGGGIVQPLRVPAGRATFVAFDVLESHMLDRFDSLVEARARIVLCPGELVQHSPLRPPGVSPEGRPKTLRSNASLDATSAPHAVECGVGSAREFYATVSAVKTPPGLDRWFGRVRCYARTRDSMGRSGVSSEASLALLRAEFELERRAEELHRELLSVAAQFDSDDLAAGMALHWQTFEEADLVQKWLAWVVREFPGSTGATRAEEILRWFELGYEQEALQAFG